MFALGMIAVDKNKDLFLFDLTSGKLIGKTNNIVSAVYNMAGDGIVASTYSMKEQILILDPRDLTKL
jgi:hypothetical protein